MDTAGETQGFSYAFVGVGFEQLRGREAVTLVSSDKQASVDHQLFISQLVESAVNILIVSRKTSYSHAYIRLEHVDQWWPDNADLPRTA
jgi:hypothetical protein